MGDLIYIEDPHSYTHDGKPMAGLTAIMVAEGYIKDDFYTREGRERGSLVHLGCEDYDRGGLDWQRLSENQIPYIEAWAQYREDFKFKPQLVEIPHHSHIYQFATTPDRIGSDKDHEVVLVEIKTGGKEGWWPIQTEAQAVAYLDDQWGSPAGVSGKSKIQRRAIQLMPNGKYKPDFHKDPKDYDVVQAMFLQYHWKANHLK